jgi:hypothetical protein
MYKFFGHLLKGKTDEQEIFKTSPIDGIQEPCDRSGRLFRLGAIKCQRSR